MRRMCLRLSQFPKTIFMYWHRVCVHEYSHYIHIEGGVEYLFRTPDMSFWFWLRTAHI